MSKQTFGNGISSFAGAWIGLGMAVLLSACTNMNQPGASADAPASGTTAAAPVGASGSAAAGTAADAQPTTTTQVVTKTTWVRVKRGDTLGHIAQSQGVSVKDLMAWNHLKPKSRLRKGQSLRIVSRQTITVNVAPASSGNAGTAANGAANSAAARQMAAEMARRATNVSLAWPAQGQVVEGFQPGENRGIEIAGHEGDPVRAAADGKVMYAGTGLNEYGSLIIVQHNKDFLTAYSHNRKLLVKTGDIVHQGQQIAEMGSESSSRVAVLFEVRRDGKPVDPMPYLPRQNG